MTAPATPAPPAPIAAELPRDDGSKRAELLPTLFSLSGVVPLGLFLVAHMFTNGKALVGDAAFTESVRRIRALPGIFAIEVLLVFAPLALHAAYGVYLVATRRSLPGPSPYSPAMRAVHRAAGVIALAYVAYHLYEYRFHQAAPGLRPGDYFTVLSARLSSTAVGAPLRAMFYMLGIAAVTFHFAAGLWGFLVRRGWFVSVRARRFAAGGAGVIGVALFVAAANLVTYFATGTRIFGHDGVTPLDVEPAPCPAPSSASSNEGP